VAPTDSAAASNGPGQPAQSRFRALRFGKLDLARQALDRVPANDRDSAAYHVVAGWLARAEGNFAGQEEQFAAAVKRERKVTIFISSI